MSEDNNQMEQENSENEELPEISDNQQEQVEENKQEEEKDQDNNSKDQDLEGEIQKDQDSNQESNKKKKKKFLEKCPWDLDEDLQNKLKDEEDEEEKKHQKHVRQEQIKPVKGQYFQPRKEIAEEDNDLELRQDTLHVYGVDFLSTDKVLRYFSKFNANKVEWLDDSSCNVVFENEDYVSKAVSDLSLTRENIEDEIWSKGLPYKEQNIEIQLYFRVATNKDVKEEKVKGNESQYYKYELSNKKKKIQKFSKFDRGYNNKLKQKQKFDNTNQKSDPFTDDCCLSDLISKFAIVGI